MLWPGLTCVALILRNVFFLFPNLPYDLISLTKFLSMDNFLVGGVGKLDWALCGKPPLL